MPLSNRKAGIILLLLASTLYAVAPGGAASGDPKALPSDPGTPHAATERSGDLQTTEWQTLRLTADLGAVRIFTLEPGAAPVVRYTVHIETDAREAFAAHVLSEYSLTAKSTQDGVQIIGATPPQSAHSHNLEAQYWVRFEVTVPRNYNLEISTGAGDIETMDIAGTASLKTEGGNIRAGKIGVPGLRETAGKAVAQLETLGGHVGVEDVAGDLVAKTGGGHINTGNISGSASLHTGGGHIRAGQIAGRAELDTDGGNIMVRQAGSMVSVRTGGGQIDFGEVKGSVRAQTGGGGIRMMYVAGPLEVETSAGSICLTRVAGSVRAETAGGTITAWINPDAPATNGAVHLAGASQLASGAGDIVVFLPRNLAATIEAIVEMGGENRIESDRELPLNIQSAGVRGPVHALGVLNGGGAVLRLKTTVGKIRLRYSDSDVALRESLIRDQMNRIGIEMPAVVTVPPGGPPEGDQEKRNWFDDLWDSFEEKWRGGIGEEPEELHKRLQHSLQPLYPEIAKKAGIQGVVRLQVRVGKDGHVEVLRLIEGEPVLADAAIAAVKQWRYKEKWMNGKKVNVISEVTFNFQLH